MLLHEAGALRIEEIPQPQPGPGEVLARVTAAGVCGSDLHFAHHADTLAGSAGAYATADLGKGVVMGHEFVAEIAALGHGVDGWQPGDRVVGPSTAGSGYSSIANGSYGEYLIMPAARLLRVPDGQPNRVIALTEPGSVALHAVREARVQPGESVLIMGAGPIGLLTLLWLKRDGYRVAVSDPAQARRDLAAALGADLVLDSAAQDFRPRLREFGAPPVVFECVGAIGTLQQAIFNVERRGRVIVVGICVEEDRLRPEIAVAKHLTLQFVFGMTPKEFADSDRKSVV